MNKFYVFPCIKCERDGYEGQAVQMACINNINNVLLFPIDPDNASLINLILNSTPEKLKTAGGTIRGYRTMLNSWASGGRFLSGIFMTVEYSTEERDYVIATNLIISDENGGVDSITKVGFVDAMIIAVLDRREVIVSNELMKKLIPKFEEAEKGEAEDNKDNKENKKKNKFPVDNEILEIAKKIMSGKIK